MQQTHLLRTGVALALVSTRAARAECAAPACGLVNLVNLRWLQSAHGHVDPGRKNTCTSQTTDRHYKNKKAIHVNRMQMVGVCLALQLLLQAQHFPQLMAMVHFSATPQFCLQVVHVGDVVAVM